MSLLYNNNNIFQKALEMCKNLNNLNKNGGGGGS